MLKFAKNSLQLKRVGEARYPSGQRGRTVNPLAYAFVGSNPTLATRKLRGNSSIGRATAFQAVGCGFEPRFPLQILECHTTRCKQRL